MNLTEVLEKALKDPQLKWPVLMPLNYAQIKKHLERLSNELYISEWRYSLDGKLDWIYHAHKKQFAMLLQDAMKHGQEELKTRGRPNLIAVYSKPDLVRIVQNGSQGTH